MIVNTVKHRENETKSHGKKLVVKRKIISAPGSMAAQESREQKWSTEFYCIVIELLYRLRLAF